MLARIATTLARELAHDAGIPSAHRPWPLPRRPWIMAQTWEDLLFLHWPISPERLRARIPDGLALDTYESQAWLSITPFVVTGLRPRGMPPLPGLSTFTETNVRTYVTRDGIPGVWFFTLDASSRLAVSAARAFYRLPYQEAEFTVRRGQGRVAYAYERRDRWAPPGAFAIEYGPVGPPAPAPPHTLAWWLTERYCLYASGAGSLYRAEIHHAPWPLQAAEAHISRNTLTEWLSAPTPHPAPVSQFARRLDVRVWAPTRLP